MPELPKISINDVQRWGLGASECGPYLPAYALRHWFSKPRDGLYLLALPLPAQVKLQLVGRQGVTPDSTLLRWARQCAARAAKHSVPLAARRAADVQNSRSPRILLRELAAVCETDGSLDALRDITRVAKQLLDAQMTSTAALACRLAWRSCYAATWAAHAAGTVEDAAWSTGMAVRSAATVYVRSKRPSQWPSCSDECEWQLQALQAHLRQWSEGADYTGTLSIDSGAITWV